MGRVPAVIAAILVSVAPAAVRAGEPGEPTEPPPAAGAPVVVEPPPDEAPAPVQPIVPASSPASAPTSAPAVAAAAAPPPVPAVPALPRRETHGLALAVGLGITYGLLGLQARYDIPIERWLIVSPFVCAGPVFGWRSGPAGLSAALGRRHRLAADIGVGPIDRWQLMLHGTTVAEETISGPLAGIGYEHMSDDGWLQRTTFEYGYATWGSAVPLRNQHHVFLGAAFGRRIW